jgi:hypothetical protein
MQTDILQIALDYIWVPIVTALTLLWSKFGGLDTRTKLLAQACAACNLRRAEDRAWRDEQRREILNKIDSHHKITMAKLEAVEVRIKNGH